MKAHAEHLALLSVVCAQGAPNLFNGCCSALANKHVVALMVYLHSMAYQKSLLPWIYMQIVDKPA